MKPIFMGKLHMWVCKLAGLGNIPSVYNKSAQ